MNTQTLHYVTTNPGKFVEVSEYMRLHAPYITMVQAAADIPEIQTFDQMAIAVDKAKKAWELIRKPLVIDDSAVYFEKYHQFPGTLSKFVSLGIGFEGIRRLIDPGDRAYFLLYVVYMDGPGSIHVFEGRCDGVVGKPDHFYGDTNLPYDVFFTPDGASVSYADMRHDLKTYGSFFYRLRGFEKFLSWYKEKR